MIPIEKLKKLPPRIFARKLSRVLENPQHQISFFYIKSGAQLCLDKISETDEPSKRVLYHAKEILSLSASTDPCYERSLNHFKHALLSLCGSEASEWDHLYEKRDGEQLQTISLKDAATDFFQITLYLDDIRAPFNLGSIFRSAEAFGVKELVLSQDCPDPYHPRSIKTSRGTVEMVPYRRLGREESLEFLAEESKQGRLFALELGGKPLSRFPFPPQATAVLGSEELGVDPKILALCDASLGRVTLPMFGTKGSINVSSAAAILLHRWNEKRLGE